MSYGRWVVFASVCVALAQDDPYCGARHERLCQAKGPHVGCQYPFRGAGPACENYTSILFSNDLKQYILHYINRRRQKIASGHERVRGGMHLPKPEIMMLVQWDRELAYLAQRLADQCQFVHDDCRATVRYPYAGQTVGEVRWQKAGKSLARGARRAIGRVLDAWWGERRRVHAKQLVSPFALTARGAVWGHFSQLAVWTLRAMGCGAVHHGAARPRLLLVCDFSHTNMLGQRTISPGPLAPCPAHTVRSGRPYPLLCAPPPAVSKIEGGYSREQDKLYDEEFGDDALEEEEVETKRTMDRSEDFYPTRPWPNRPVRPIQHDTDTAVQSVKEDYIPEDTENLPVNSNRARVNLKKLRTTTDYKPVGQHKLTDLDRLPVRDHETSDHHARAGYSSVDSQPMRHHEMMSVDRRLRPSHDVRPIQNVRPVQNVRPTQDVNPVQVRPTNDARPEEDDRPVQNDESDYGYDRQDDVVEANRPSHAELETENRESVNEDLSGIDKLAMRPMRVDVADSNVRTAVSIDDGSAVGAVRRTFKPLRDDDEDDEPWIKTEVTKAVHISLKHRGQSLFSQKLNDELNIRNQELRPRSRDEDLNNGIGQSETRMRPQTINRSDNKALLKSEGFRSSENRRKGEYKAYNGNRQKSEWNPIPFQFDRWRDTKVLDMNVLPLKQTRPPASPITVVVYRPTSLFTIQTEPAYRQRWMQTRVRPRRPGANALLQNAEMSNPAMYVDIRKGKKTSLVLDKDDEEQLYHDTGFKLPTTKSPNDRP